MTQTATQHASSTGGAHGGHAAHEPAAGGTGGVEVQAPGQAPLTDHAYDGIQEFDNPTPGWWHLIFYATVVFSIGYWIIFEADHTHPSIWDVWAQEQAAEYKRLFAGIGELKPDEDTMRAMMADPKWMAFGAATFKGNCVNCHGSNAEGGIGPNLTDNFFKSVKALTDLPRVIRDGAAEGAMPAWKGRLSENEIILVASYVATLRGKSVPGAAPLGVEIPAFPEPKAKAPTEPAPKPAGG